MYCLKCLKYFEKTYGEKQRNCKECEGVLYHECKACEKRYRNYCDMTMHLKYDCNEEKVLACKQCEYTTSRRARLNDHYKAMHTVTDSKDFINCPKCQRSFRFVRYLRWHLVHECGDENWNYCPEKNCDFKTKYATSLRKHMNIHYRDESVTNDCAKCGKKYKTRGAMLNHVRNLY
ncbi:zinc finger protein 37-like [Copidosoma floridanum]|uniref:zinc finger protein 37-like n=1 Tax=Copidosoma floridanum TaxID=29053 RepID=UPI0006C94243|nr:zinc finger protein 37-like [Copidosoma floridanum]